MVILFSIIELKTIKSLEKIGRYQNINKFTEDFSRNTKALNIQADKISKRQTRMCFEFSSFLYFKRKRI